MDRPSVIEDLKRFNETNHGLELSNIMCSEVVKYIEDLEGIAKGTRNISHWNREMREQAENALEVKNRKIAEYKKALDKASSMLSILVSPEAQMVKNCEGVYFNSSVLQYEWLMNFAAEELSKESSNGK